MINLVQILCYVQGRLLGRGGAKVADRVRMCRFYTGTSLCSMLAYNEREGALPKPEKPVALKDEPMTHQFVLRQSSVLSVEAVTRVLTQTVVALQDANRDYCQKVGRLISLYNMGDDGLPPVMANQQMYQQMVELKIQVSSDKKNVQDLDLLFSYVQKLVDAAAETSFLIGADYASVQASERLHSALNVVQQEIAAREALEKELTLAEKSLIERTKVGSDSEIPGEQKLDKNDILKESNKLEKADPVVFGEDIKVTAREDGQTQGNATTEKFAFSFENNSDEETKISVKQDDNEDFSLSVQKDDMTSDFSDEEFNFPLHRKEFNDKEYDEFKYKLPSF